MTFTYSSTDLSTTLAVVRLLLGDTDSSDPQLTDEEIAAFTTRYGGVYFPAAAACDALASKYARYTSKTVGRLSIQYGERAEHYAKLADQLRRQAATSALVPYAGGISDSDKQTQEADTDRVKPQFLLGMDDYPGTGPGRPGGSSS